MCEKAIKVDSRKESFAWSFYDEAEIVWGEGNF